MRNKTLSMNVRTYETDAKHIESAKFQADKLIAASAVTY